MENTDYLKSKSLETIPALEHAAFDKKLRDSIVSEVSPQDSVSRKVYGQAVVNAICQKLGIPKVTLDVVDCPQQHQDSSRGTLKNKTLGWYKHSGSHGLKIRIYNLTAKTHKIVSSKVFFNTLIHEVCHHIDVAYLHISSTPHTSGFYKRISFLESKFC